jgi:hypothetical protein
MDLGRCLIGDLGFVFSSGITALPRAHRNAQGFEIKSSLNSGWVILESGQLRFLPLLAQVSEGDGVGGGDPFSAIVCGGGCSGSDGEGF